MYHIDYRNHPLEKLRDYARFLISKRVITEDDYQRFVRLNTPRVPGAVFTLEYASLENAIITVLNTCDRNAKELCSVVRLYHRANPDLFIDGKPSIEILVYLTVKLLLKQLNITGHHFKMKHLPPEDLYEFFVPESVQEWYRDVYQLDYQNRKTEEPRKWNFEYLFD